MSSGRIFKFFRLKKSSFHIFFLKTKIFAAAFFLSSFSVFSLSKKDFSIEAQPIFALKSGRADEFVFLNSSNSKSEKYSELNWKFDNEFCGGLKINFGFKNIFLENSFTAGIPSYAGKMQDSDWQNLTGTSSSKDYQWRTNYSESDNFLEYDYSYKFKAGASFNFPKIKKLKFSLSPFAGFQLNFFKFNAKNGEYWYGKKLNGYYAKWNDSENQENGTFSGKVVSYKRNSSIFWLGFDANLNLSDDFVFSSGFKFSPYLYCESIDNHHLRNDDFLDVTPGYFAAFEWNFGAEYKITKRQSICLNAEYFFMRVLQGDSYAKSSSQKKFKESNKISGYEGGAAERYLALSLSYKIKILGSLSGR